MASDSLVEAAADAVAVVLVSSTFDTVTVLCVSGPCVLVAVTLFHTLLPSLPTEETKLLTPLLASANTEPTAEVA